MKVVADYMTFHPHWVAPDSSMKKAMELMTQHQIRHLPVKDGDRVVGMVSDRDLKLFYGMPGFQIETTPVSRICHGDPYLVRPDASLREVAREMAAKHYGSAVVMERGEMVGIFTTTDACRALADLSD